MSPLPLQERTQGEKPTDSRHRIQESLLLHVSEGVRQTGLQLYLDARRSSRHGIQNSIQSVIEFRSGRLPEKQEIENPSGSSQTVRTEESKIFSRGRAELPSLRERIFTHVVPNFPQPSADHLVQKSDYRELYLEANGKKDELQSELLHVQGKLNELLLEMTGLEEASELPPSQNLLETTSRVCDAVRLLQSEQTARSRSAFRRRIASLFSQANTGGKSPRRNIAAEEATFVESLQHGKPKWKERSDKSQSPLDFLEIHYGEFLTRFAAPQNTLFQDQLRFIDKSLFVAITNHLADRFDSLGLRMKDFIPPKSERISARIEEGHDDPRTNSAKHQREHRRRLREKKLGDSSPSKTE